MVEIRDIIKEKFGREKKFFTDAILNMAAFTIYIFSQQIILLPILAKILHENDYANVIVCITLMNAFCNILGGQLGVTHQLQKNKYNDDNNERNDFFFLMGFASIIICLIFPFVLKLIGLKIEEMVFFTVVVLLSNFRIYIRYYFRITGKYKHTIIQNIFYLIGIIVGVLLYNQYPKLWLPLFLAEGFSMLYTLKVVPYKNVSFKCSRYFLDTLKRYIGLGSVDALTNLITLVDKLMVYPLLGAYSLAVYNAGTATSKISALVMNPLNEVMLVRLAKTADAGLSKFVKTIINTSLIVILISFIVFIPIIYILSAILYHQFLDDILKILVMLSISCSIDITSSVMKNFILRFARPQQLTFCYFLNLLFIGFGGIIGAKYWGIAGFAFSMVISQIEKWISFVIILVRLCKKQSAM